METKFFELCQNNTGGSFDVTENLCHRLIIEAHSEEEALNKAEELGCYWDGVSIGYDCSCCGDRWSRYTSEVNLDEIKRSGYSVGIYDHYPNAEEEWQKKYGNYSVHTAPQWERKIFNSFKGLIIYFNSLEQYCQFMADEYGWTKPEIRIFYLDGRKVDVLMSKDKNAQECDTSKVQ